MSKHRLGLLTVSVLPASLHSAVVIYSPNLTISGPSQQIGFNLSSGEAAIGSVPPGSSFGLSYTFSDLDKPQLGPLGDPGQEVAYYLVPGDPISDSMAVNFSVGATIDASSFIGSNSAYLSKPGISSAFPAGTRGYAGLRYGTGGDWNYGWADISYNADLSLTLHRFANETTLNLGIQPIPESGAGVAGALVAGALGAWKARERFVRSRRSAPAVEAA
jgi:hypothetical protein